MASFLPFLTYFQVLPPLLLVVCFSLAAFFVWLFHWPAKHIKINPMRASKFRPEFVSSIKKIDTIVVGSGSGGCACANLLAQSGKKVLILEQHPTITGGCTHTFREDGCEWDTGLHYTSMAMGTKTKRPGALMHFMTKSLQKWTPLEDPYDVVMFPGESDDKVKQGLPNKASYSFIKGKENVVDNILKEIDPNNQELRAAALRYMDLCQDITSGFTALGLSRVLPTWMQFLVKARIDRLMKFAAMTVRDVQYAIFNLGYTKERLLQDGCPKAPKGPEPDRSLRRLKAVLTHPIGDYAVQPRDATSKWDSTSICIFGAVISHD